MENKLPLRQQEAFEFYYSLRHARTLQQVCNKFNISLSTVQKWSSNGKWREMVKDRDINNAKKIQEQTDTTIIETTSKYLNIVQKTLTKYEEALQAGNIKINSVQDLEKLAKLEMFLREDEMSKRDTNINIIFKRTKTQNTPHESNK
jgi:hypothetical protein